MKIRYSMLFILLSVCASAHAEWFLRGTHNGWGATQMVVGGTNTMQLNNVVFTSAGSIKFDRFGDWKENYGVGGRGGSNIPVAAGTWNIKFFTDTKNWKITAVSVASSSKSSSSSAKSSSSVSSVKSSSKSSVVTVSSSAKSSIKSSSASVSSSKSVTSISSKGLSSRSSSISSVITSSSVIKSSQSFSSSSVALSSASSSSSAGLQLPAGIVLDAAHNRILLMDRWFDVVSAIDTASGVRTVLSEREIIDDHNGQMAMSHSMAIDSAHSRLLVADADLDAIIAVDLTSGLRTVLSSSTSPNATNAFRNPADIIIDGANNRALVADSGLSAIISVDLTSGERTVLSDNSKSAQTDVRLFAPRSLALDSVHNRVLVNDVSLHGFTPVLLAVDLTSGARTLLVDTVNEVEGFQINGDIAFDEISQRVLLTDESFGAVIAFDLITGVRTIFSGNGIPDTMNNLNTPIGIAIDSPNNRALVVDFRLNAVVSVDLVTGERAIFAK